LADIRKALYHFSEKLSPVWWFHRSLPSLQHQGISSAWPSRFR
jgi:hypothetical protein